jgi:exosortase/archaeosortase family protein
MVEGRAAAGGPDGRFATTFLLLAAAGLGLYFFPYEQVGLDSGRVYGPYLSAYARMTGIALRLFDPTVSVAGATINGRFAMQIVRSCDAMEVNVLFAAAVLAFPAPWARKGKALAAGLSALVSCNVIRLCTLYFVGAYLPARFDAAHYEIWPLAFLVLATVAFLVAARWMGASPPQDPTIGTLDATR